MRSAVARTQTPPEEVEQLRRGAGKASSGEWLLCPPPDAVEIYFIKSISAYQATLGPEDCETLTTIEEFCKWLIQNGERQCLMIQILLYGSEHSKSRDTKKSPYSPAEVFYYREEKVYT